MTFLEQICQHICSKNGGNMLNFDIFLQLLEHLCGSNVGKIIWTYLLHLFRICDILKKVTTYFYTNQHIQFYSKNGENIAISISKRGKICQYKKW